uniref:Uncharacterized protein n=1 Tax=Compsopogon caeruleus TaxID=31354 RepID=A0A6T6AN15_9RHOD|mmetsp:Transcript_11663/g.23728  ORF Transcript_11663/g.23728 Transcript_11663/m.23728 type:complete len:2262 (+) Transcript_11663:90-6875(+)
MDMVDSTSEDSFHSASGVNEKGFELPPSNALESFVTRSQSGGRSDSGVFRASRRGFQGAASRQGSSIRGGGGGEGGSSLPLDGQEWVSPSKGIGAMMRSSSSMGSGAWSRLLRLRRRHGEQVEETTGAGGPSGQIAGGGVVRDRGMNGERFHGEVKSPGASSPSLTVLPSRRVQFSSTPAKSGEVSSSLSALVSASDRSLTDRGRPPVDDELEEDVLTLEVFEVDSAVSAAGNGSIPGVGRQDSLRAPVIGISADPGAELDDWASDFVFDEDREARRRSEGQEEFFDPLGENLGDPRSISRVSLIDFQVEDILFRDLDVPETFGTVQLSEEVNHVMDLIESQGDTNRFRLLAESLSERIDIIQNLDWVETHSSSRSVTLDEYERIHDPTLLLQWQLEFYLMKNDNLEVCRQRINLARICRLNSDFDSARLHLDSARDLVTGLTGESNDAKNLLVEFYYEEAVIASWRLKLKKSGTDGLDLSLKENTIVRHFEAAISVCLQYEEVPHLKWWELRCRYGLIYTLISNNYLLDGLTQIRLYLKQCFKLSWRLEVFDGKRFSFSPRDLGEALLLLLRVLILTRLMRETRKVLDILNSFLPFSPYEALHSNACRLEDEVEQILGAGRDFQDFEGDMDEEGDWDEELAKELNVKIERNTLDSTLAWLDNAGPSFASPILGRCHQFYSNSIDRDEVANVLHSVHVVLGNSALQIMYPKPTEPMYEGKAMGPGDHERWLLAFVRDKLLALSQLENDAEVDPMRYYQMKLPYTEKFTEDWANLTLHTCWRLSRNAETSATARQSLASVVQDLFGQLAAFGGHVRHASTIDAEERMYLFSIGKAALWFSLPLIPRNEFRFSVFERLAHQLISLIADSPRWLDSTNCGTNGVSVILSVSIFIVQVRVHLGRGVDHNPSARSLDSYVDELSVILRESKTLLKECEGKEAGTPNDAHGDRHSVSWQLLCAYGECLVSLVLVLLRLSPVDFSPLSWFVSTASTYGNVTIYNSELATIYRMLPDSAVIKAKVAFGLASIARFVSHEYSLAERYMLDCLKILKTAKSVLTDVFPAAMVSSSLAQSALEAYSDVLLRNGKYRYAIASLEASLDCQRQRENDEEKVYLSCKRIAMIAASWNDWRSALRFLFQECSIPHPKNGLRNEFMQFCLLTSRICSKAGCFDAALVPLEAGMALLKEERVRDLLKNDVRRSRSRRTNMLKGAASGAAKKLKKIFKFKHLNPDSRSRIDFEGFLVSFTEVKLLFDKCDLDRCASLIEHLLQQRLSFTMREKTMEIQARLFLRQGKNARSLKALEDLRAHLLTHESRNAIFKEETISQEGLFGGAVRCRDLHDVRISSSMTLLRVKALLAAEKFPNALDYVEVAIESCSKESNWLLGKLFSFRGRILSTLLSEATPFNSENYSATSLGRIFEHSSRPDLPPYKDAVICGRILSLALEAFQISSRYFSAAGDEVRAAKADASWARSVLDYGIRTQLLQGCHVFERRAISVDGAPLIYFGQIEAIITDVVKFAARINLPLLLLDSLISSAELRLLSNDSSHRLRAFIMDIWSIFSKLFTDGESFSILVAPFAPIALLLKLRLMLGRMTRAFLFDDTGGSEAANEHIRVFEAYITINQDIVRRFNLSHSWRETSKVDEEETSRKDSTTYSKALHKKEETAPSTIRAAESLLRFLTKEGYDLGVSGYKVLLDKPGRKLLTAIRGSSYALSQVPLFDKLLQSSRWEDDVLGTESVQFLGLPSHALGQLLLNRENVRGVNDQFESTSSRSQKIWTCIHRIKEDRSLMTRGELTTEEFAHRSGEHFRLWFSVSWSKGKSWILPKSTLKHSVFILNPLGILGYYVTERGRCVRRVSTGYLGSFSNSVSSEENMYEGSHLAISRMLLHEERQYFVSMLRENRYYPREWQEVKKQIRHLAEEVFCAPRVFLHSGSTVRPHEPEARPVLLICDSHLQGVPWELFFDQGVVRAHGIIDAIRGSQSASRIRRRRAMVVRHGQPVARYVVFYSERSDDAEIVDEKRRHLATFRFLSQLKFYSTEDLITHLGGEGYPSSLDAAVRSTGPLMSPLVHVSHRTAHRESFISRKYPSISFVGVSGLVAATGTDLAEALGSMNAHFLVILCTFGELIDLDSSVFDLLKRKPNALLLFIPPSFSEVVARYFEDWELNRLLADTFEKDWNLISAVKIFVREVSKFSREKLIPMSIFLGEDLNRIFPKPRRGGMVRSASSTLVGSFTTLGRLQRPQSNPLLRDMKVPQVISSLSLAFSTP